MKMKQLIILHKKVQYKLHSWSIPWQGFSHIGQSVLECTSVLLTIFTYTCFHVLLPALLSLEMSAVYFKTHCSDFIAMYVALSSIRGCALPDEFE